MKNEMLKSVASIAFASTLFASSFAFAKEGAAGNGTGNLGDHGPVSKRTEACQPPSCDPLKPWRDAFNHAQPLNIDSVTKGKVVIFANKEGTSYNGLTGSIIYLDGTSPVTKAAAEGIGALYVNGWLLEDLKKDVAETTYEGKDLVVYESTSGLWPLPAKCTFRQTGDYLIVKVEAPDYGNPNFLERFYLYVNTKTDAINQSAVGGGL